MGRRESLFQGAHPIPVIGRVPRPCLVVFARQGGDFDCDRNGKRRVEIKVPTLPQRTREGWGTRCLWMNPARVKGVGQECPTHMSRFPSTPLRAGFFERRVGCGTPGLPSTGRVQSTLGAGVSSEEFDILTLNISKLILGKFRCRILRTIPRLTVKIVLQVAALKPTSMPCVNFI